VNGFSSQSPIGAVAPHFSDGVPVSGKNLFPSEHPGLPRGIPSAQQAGSLREKRIDVLGGMTWTAQEDVLSLPPGAACVYDEL